MPKLIRYMILVAVLLTLLVGCLTSSGLVDASLFPNQDKLHHFLGFAALAFSTRLAFPHQPVWRAALASWVISAAIEYAQQYVPGRSSDWHDLIANTVGIGFGLVSHHLANRWFPRWINPRV